MRNRLSSLLFAILLLCFVPNLSIAQTPEPHVSVLVEGLQNPVNLALLPYGELLIAEEGTGNDDLSAGVSLRQTDGTVGRLISGIRSGRDSGDLSGVALVAVSPDNNRIYVGNFAQGHLWTLDIPESQPLTLPETPYTTDDMGKTMTIFNRVTLTNPFDMTFDAEGVPVVADSSQNGVAKALPDGRTIFIHRFAELENPTNPETTIDSVPTGIDRIGEEYYVTLTGGCPYPQGGGELVAIDESRNQRTVLDDLNMPIDVAQGVGDTIWLLEFARFPLDGSCFDGASYLPNTGRLSRIAEDGTRETVLDNLNFPTSVLPLPDGSLYITEIFDGEVLHITFDERSNAQETEFVRPQLDIPQPEYADIPQPDDLIQRIIDVHDLTPYVGQDMLEGNTAIADLGRDLFFDPILSGDKNISCATCHHPAFAMTDGRVLPIGTGGIGLGDERDFLTHITLSEEYYGAEANQRVPNPSIGQFVPRNSPTIINSVLLDAQFWDGRVENYAATITTLEDNVNNLGLTDTLAAQALFPIISRAEMSGATFGEEAAPVIRNALAERLTNIPEYRQRFQQIFDTDTIEPVHIVSALAAFERQFIFTESAWDDYLAGDENALTEQQKRGAMLFYGELNPDVNCAACHSGDMFTDLDYHNLLVPQLGPGKGNGDNGREDWGRANVTFDVRDRYQFRTPSLRNVELTAPYMHTGAYRTLEDAIRHHANIWDSAANYDPSAHLPQQFYSSLRPFDAESMHATVAPELANGLPLTDADIADLVAFLKSLTDPAARDLMHFLPESVPSGLALDPMPKTDMQAAITTEPAAPQSISETDIGLAPDGLYFRNVANDVGLDFVHGAFQLGLYDDPIAMMGAGLCWLDFDNDGWLDLYLVNSHAEDEFDALQADDALPRNTLYRNVEGQFTQVDNSNSDLVMRGNGCVAADFNVDGWADLYVTADGDDVMLLNNGDDTFTPVSNEETGIIAPEWNSNANVAELNNDGLPDLFVGGYIDLDNKIPNPFGAFPQDYYGIPDRLFISTGIVDGVPQYRDVTQEVGLVREERTLGAVFTDADRDGDLDLYVANDGQPNRLYEYIASDDHEFGFTFADLTATAEVGDAGSGMGVTSADYDGDGMFDLFVTNWEAELNALYRNETHEEGFINYRYSTYRIGMRGLGNDMTGWGTKWADFDHDTDIDLMTVNGRVPVTNFETDPELVRFYGNRLVEKGVPEYFEWTAAVGLDNVGTLLARGSAVADYDNDGDLDIAINTIGGDVALLQNNGVTGNWLQIEFESPQAGLVTEITLPDGRVLLRELQIGSSYLASEDPRLHIGLDAFAEVTSVVVYYRGEIITTLKNVAANQTINILN